VALLSFWIKEHHPSIFPLISVQFIPAYIPLPPTTHPGSSRHSDGDIDGNNEGVSEGWTEGWEVGYGLGWGVFPLPTLEILFFPFSLLAGFDC